MILQIEAFLAKWGLRIALAVSLVGSIWYHGYSKGKESVTSQAATKIIKETQRQAREGVARAQRDARVIEENKTEGETLREKYENQPVSEVDPLNCISPEQRRVLAETINRQRD